MTGSPAVQDRYPEQFSHCYGCGRLNAHGLHVQTRWEGDMAVARYTPRPEHIAVPGFIYGGLIASLVDCHGIGTAALAAERAAGHEGQDQPAPRFVTASLKVDFLKPTPAGHELVLRARPVTVGERKVVVEVHVYAGDQRTVRADVIAVRLPESMDRAIREGGTAG